MRANITISVDTKKKYEIEMLVMAKEECRLYCEEILE